MILKRIASKGNKKARNCLKCNSRLLNLKDNVVNTCEVCGQQHLVDFYTNNTIVLTAAERPELRKRPREHRNRSNQSGSRTRKLLISDWQNLEKSGRSTKDVFKDFLSSNYRMFSFGMSGSKP